MRGYAYLAQWMRGYPRRAEKTNKGCLALAKKIDHPPSIGFALTARTGFSYLEGDAKRTLVSANRALRFVKNERLGFWEPMISVFRGWALSERGKRKRGVRIIRNAIQRYRAAGNGILQVWMEVILASALWRAGKRTESFDTLRRAKALAEENGEGQFEPELYRLEGQFLYEAVTGARGPSKVRSGNDHLASLAEAERCVRESIVRARGQEAKMLELRSQVTLCRIQCEMGTVTPEYDALAKTYKTFTEGFDAPDLIAARAVLEPLGAV
jgi:hypothetical protein